MRSTVNQTKCSLSNLIGFPCRAIRVAQDTVVEYFAFMAFPADAHSCIGRETFFIGKDGLVKDVCDKMVGVALSFSCFSTIFV
jgi:hypothetical protein